MEDTLEQMVYNNAGLDDDTLIDLYHKLVIPRMIEEKMLNLLRLGQISKWFSGIGQEAISVGCTAALLPEEKIFSMHRNLGVFTTREVPLEKLFGQWQGKKTGFTKGRDRSFHFGTLEYNIIGMISHLGPQLSLAAGVALAHKLKNESKVSLAFTGEGGTSQGEFHEALNVAAVWNLPVIFAIENNGYGLSTPVREQYKVDDLAIRGSGYGMESHIIDGNNILEVYATVKRLAEDMRINPRPVLLEFKTFRMRGHEEASGTKYVPKELMDHWAKKDPIQNYESYLIDLGLITADDIQEYKIQIKNQINKSVEQSFSLPEITSTIDQEIKDLFAPYNSPASVPSQTTETKEMRVIDAISDGLRQSMRRHTNLVLMGQDIADYGGVFKITDGFLAEFGAGRVRNTPLCESAIIGIGLGLSLEGMKAMVEMQFADFVTCGFNQIINNLAKLHYRWGANADVVIRMPAGGGMSAGPYHSQSNEAWFFKTPGLKIAYPSNPADAKGLLMTAFDDPNPVLFFEHKFLYRSLKGEVPIEAYSIPFGQAAVTRPGGDFTIITYGAAVHWATEAIEEMDVDGEVIDLRTLAPLDMETIIMSVKKTHRAMLLHEDTMTGGIGAEIAARLGEELFADLDAPIMRVASLDTPVPFAKNLEETFMGKSRLKESILNLIQY